MFKNRLCKLNYINTLQRHKTKKDSQKRTRKFKKKEIFRACLETKQNLFLELFLIRKCQLQGLRSRKKRSLLIVNEYLGGKRNDASGTLWTEN